MTRLAGLLAPTAPRLRIRRAEESHVRGPALSGAARNARAKPGMATTRAVGIHFGDAPVMIYLPAIRRTGPVVRLQSSELGVAVVFVYRAACSRSLRPVALKMILAARSC